MRKVNRILMATIAVLLSLVLITTSVVSGIFAKFVISKEATVSMNLEQFGVTLTITPDSALTAAGATVTPNITDNTAVIEANIPMAIGDAFYNAFKVQVTGKPNTDVKFIMTCHIEYDDSTNGAFTVESGIGGLKNATRYMPLGYTICFKEKGDGFVYVCRPYHNHDSNGIEEVVVRNVAKRLLDITYADLDATTGTKTPYDSTKKDYYLETEFAKNKDISGNVKNFYLGFDWPHQYNSYPSSNVSNADKIVTRLSEKATNITIKYTFRIEQIAEPKT